MLLLLHCHPTGNIFICSSRCNYAKRMSAYIGGHSEAGGGTAKIPPQSRRHDIKRTPYSWNASSVDQHRRRALCFRLRGCGNIYDLLHEINNRVFTSYIYITAIICKIIIIIIILKLSNVQLNREEEGTQWWSAHHHTFGEHRELRFVACWLSACDDDGTLWNHNSA